MKLDLKNENKSNYLDTNNYPEQLDLALDSFDVLETLHKTTTSQSWILDWNIVWDSCPNCQSEVWDTGFCVNCWYSLNNNYNNEFEKHLSQQELCNYINNLDGVFWDINIRNISCDIIEIDWKSRDRTTFISKGLSFEILSLWSSVIYYVEWKEFSLSDIPRKSYDFWLMRARLNISTKWKFKQRDILEDMWEDASYMKNLKEDLYFNIPGRRVQFINIEWKILEDYAEIHLLAEWKKIKVTVKYKLSEWYSDNSSWKVPSYTDVIKFQIYKKWKWIDEWRLQPEEKKNLIQMINIDILNNYKFNPYIIN